MAPGEVATLAEMLEANPDTGDDDAVAEFRRWLVDAAVGDVWADIVRVERVA